MIEVRNLTKRFGPTTALQDLSFSMRPGEILGFLGPNGAGKTTTIRILSGYLTPTEGEAYVAGLDLRTDSREARRHIGYLPEAVPVYRELTVMEYLQFVSDMKNVDSTHRLHHIDTIINQCGLGDVRNRLCGFLSKGFRQRLGLAQALISDPDILILDEPTSGLDPQQIIEIRELIRNLGGERTIILSSHILPEVSQLCERVIILNRGRLIAVDTPDNLDRSLSGSDIVFADVAGSNDLNLLIDALQSLEGVASVDLLSQGDPAFFRLQIQSAGESDIRPRIASVVIESGWQLLELRRQIRTLEDIFIQLVTREETIQ